MTVRAGVFLGSYHYALGPFAAVLVVLAMLLLSRWVFSTTLRDRRAAVLRSRGDFGLLVPAVTVGDRAEAERDRQVLLAAGLRVTLADAPPAGAGQPVRISSDGRVRPAGGLPGVHVLVFPDDVERARSLLHR